MNSNPLVSVIIPSYNAAKTIKTTINSVIDQNYQNWELLIINDGSVDDTENIVKEMLSDKRIKFHTQKNQGVAIARNLGISKAAGQFIAFLDADDIWTKDKLAMQVDFFLERPELGLVYTRNMVFHDNDIAYAYLNKYVEPFKVANDYYRLLISDFIVTSSVMVKKSIMLNMCFDSTFVGTEDWDLWIRISKVSKIGLIDKPLIYYREHTQGISKNHTKQLYNDFLVREKHVFSDETLPQEIKKKSGWMLQKKRIYEALVTKSKLSAIKQYLIMIYKYPLYRETYKIIIKKLY